MAKIDKCDRCRFYGHNPHLVCALHPSGVTKDCADYQLDPTYEEEEQWCPEGYTYYNGELIKLPENKPSQIEQLWLLNNHPCFTGQCNRCGYHFPAHSRSWNCPECGCVH